MRDCAYHLTVLNTDILYTATESLAENKEHCVAHLYHILINCLKGAFWLERRFLERNHDHFAIFNVLLQCLQLHINHFEQFCVLLWCEIKHSFLTSKRCLVGDFHCLNFFYFFLLNLFVHNYEADCLTLFSLLEVL